MSAFTIKQGAPVPPGKPGRIPLFPYAKLAVGESFAVPLKSVERPDRLQFRLSGLACSFARRQSPTWQYTTRKVVEDGEQAIRVWRIR